MQYLRSEQVLNNILSIRIKIYMKERGCCLDHNSCIYQIKNKINGKKYIGQTSDFQKRKNSHLSALRRGKCFNSYLQRAFDVYGEDAFEFSILEYCDVDDLDKREEFWISREGSYFRGYNLNIGGCGKRGFHLSEETKEKIRCANKGRVVSKETKERMRKNHADFSGKNHPMYGIAWSDRFSKERQDIIREKMSEAQKGAKNHNYGKHISEEQKKKHSELMKEYYMKNENPMKNRKRPELSGERSYRAHSVICLNTSEYFSTVDAAAKAYGVSQSSISSCCSGKLYSAGKLKDGTPIVWKYSEDVCGMKEDMHIASSYGYGEVAVTNNGARMMYQGENDQIYISSGQAGIHTNGTKYNFQPTMFYPSTRTITLGADGAPWGQIYTTDSPITTSDRNRKTDIVYDIDSRFDTLWGLLKPCTGKFVDGTSGRTHMFLISQDVEQAIEDAGLSSTDFAAFIKSPREEEEGYDYGLRYEEFVPLTIRHVQQLEEKVRDLEAQLSSLQ